MPRKQQHNWVNLVSKNTKAQSHRQFMIWRKAPLWSFSVSSFFTHHVFIISSFLGGKSMSILLTNGLYSENECYGAPKVSSVFQKGCKLSSRGCICSRSERVQTQASLQCVCVCLCVCVCFVCCNYMAHKHHVEHIFSCFYRDLF